MRVWFVVALAATLGCAVAALAAPTGYVDDFTGGTANWPANPGYKVSLADGIATFKVDKIVPWAGQKLLLGDTYDFSMHPYLTVRIKTSAPMILDVYLLGPKSGRNQSRRIRAVSDFQTYGFDFSAGKAFDATQVTGLIFCVNGEATSWEGIVQLEDVRVGDQAS